MAVLNRSPLLTLGLWEASEKQRNGEAFVVGSSVPVSITKKFYDKVFKLLSEKREIKSALRKITTEKMETEWRTIYGVDFVGVHIPQGTIKVTPCIRRITPDVILVTIPFYIEGAMEKQIEHILKRCTSKENLTCIGNEIHVELESVLFEPSELPI